MIIAHMLANDNGAIFHFEDYRFNVRPEDRVTSSNWPSGITLHIRLSSTGLSAASYENETVLGEYVDERGTPILPY